ncbi:MAG: hypothetical protein ABIN24_01320 [Dyadobacter sp.]
MKTPDQDIDEALRKALKRKFDDFAPEPDPSWKSRIFAALKTSNRPYIWPMLLAAAFVTVIITTTIVYDFIQVKTQVKSKILNTKNSVKKDFDKHLKHEKVTVFARSGKLNSQNISDTKPGKLLKAENENIDLEKGNKGKLYLANKVKTGIKAIKIKPTQAIFSVGKMTEATNHLKAFNDKKAENSFVSLVVAGTEPIAHESQLTSINNKRELSELKTPDLKPLEIRGFTLSDFKPVLKVDTQSTAKTESTRPSIAIAEKSLKFIFNMTSTNTFQELTIRAVPGVIYQNVSFPTKFSAKRPGFKLTGGLEKSGFQVLLNYSQFDQSFKYEIATDEFLVDEKSAAGDKIIRKGTKYDEKSTLKLIGIGLKKHAVITENHVLRNYFGDVGMEYARELTTGSNMIWVNAGFGKEIGISKNTSLTIGPYLEYSFMKLVNPDSKFQVRPYQIGLAAGLRFGRK